MSLQYALLRENHRFIQHKIVHIFLPIILNICFGCSKEPSHWDGSFGYLQHMFWLRNKKIIFLLHTFIIIKSWKTHSSTPDWGCHCFYPNKQLHVDRHLSDVIVMLKRCHHVYVVSQRIQELLEAFFIPRRSRRDIVLASSVCLSVHPFRPSVRNHISVPIGQI